MPLTDDPWLPSPDSDGNIPAARPAAPVGVFRFDGTPLPNVECHVIEHGEGTDPGRAVFRYNLASGLDGAPSTMEEALSSAFSGPLVVNPGDRLLVRAQRPDGFIECLFDGEATDFGMSISPDAEDVSMTANGIAWRCWDRPIGGALMRNADRPTRVEDIPTRLTAHFNPDGKPNCTPDGFMSGSASNGLDRRYPTFLDPLAVRDPDGRTYWTPAKAVRYLLNTENGGQAFVRNPDGAYLDNLLNALGGGDRPVPVPDLPITGKDWPGTVHRLVNEIGVGMNFALVTRDDGGVETRLNLFPQQGGTPKNLYLAPRGTAFRPDLFNFNAGSIHRDVVDVVNRWVVEGASERHEVSLILKPGFPMVAADGDDANIKNFNKGTVGTGNKYRLYVFDETGEGHYAPGTNTKLDDIPSLDDIFGAPEMGVPKYVRRRRRALGTLVSLDADKLPRKARLWISTDYAGPRIWDMSGHWREVTSTTWQLLPDRLGIRITDKNPESWQVGGTDGAGIPFTGGTVRGISSQATTGSSNFTLRLTCAIDGDQRVIGTATRGPGSPLSRDVERVVDASDRYRKDVVDLSSDYAPFGVATPTVARDDTKAALAEAIALRTATEAGVLGGPVVIPRLTTYYKVGDRIASIEGRGLGFRTDAGTGNPVYPAVVAVRHEFGPDSQTTTVELSDAGSDRRRYERKRRRVSFSGGGRLEVGTYGPPKPPWPSKGYATNKTFGSGGVDVASSNF